MEQACQPTILLPRPNISKLQRLKSRPSAYFIQLRNVDWQISSTKSVRHSSVGSFLSFIYRAGQENENIFDNLYFELKNERIDFWRKHGTFTPVEH